MAFASQGREAGGVAPAKKKDKIIIIKINNITMSMIEK